MTTYCFFTQLKHSWRLRRRLQVGRGGPIPTHHQVYLTDLRACFSTEKCPRDDANGAHRDGLSSTGPFSLA